MELELYHVDAFTSRVFSGNPACVVLLETWLSDDILLAMAREHAVAETAYILHMGAGRYRLRWFTPDLEMDLCGHATLASGHVIFNHVEPDLGEVQFETISGTLTVSRLPQGGYAMILPKRAPSPAILPDEIEAALNTAPVEVLKARDFMLVYRQEDDIRSLQVNRQIFDRINLGTGGVIVTAPGDEVDFVSRFFTPQATILEDPVTGSAHCTSAPFWAEKLGKTQLRARQLSQRGGELNCEILREEVRISGHAVTYSTSRILLP